MASIPTGETEDDGYLLTAVSDLARDASETTAETDRPGAAGADGRVSFGRCVLPRSVASLVGRARVSVFVAVHKGRELPAVLTDAVLASGDERLLLLELLDTAAAVASPRKV
ncbi:hypothetical protein [Embleya sp. NBC_00896]|uniref:hypothetical protein n=1 Tax=Embleya sp. NBC_00896 TaxID=2975961 RepID=UPI00386D7FF1|nr:carotenoid oxygenase family protein [Embleya sp. NBC_00896]